MNVMDKSAIQAGGSAAKPEEGVRQKIIKELLRLGWKEGQLRWKPEWPVPSTPHDLTKRERGQKYDICGTSDLVIFADTSGEAHALQVIFEFKAPDIEAGRMQLMRYMSGEPMPKMGFWTNGTQSLAVYKRHSADWVWVEGAALPQPGDDLSRAPDKPPSWNSIRTPSEGELSAVLRRIVATVVVSDYSRDASR
jgi:hypothetical protein